MRALILYGIIKYDMWEHLITDPKGMSDWTFAISCFLLIGELYNVWQTVVAAMDDEDWDCDDCEEDWKETHPILGEILKLGETQLSSGQISITRDLIARLSRVRSPATLVIQILRSKLVASTGLDFNALLLAVRPPSRFVKRRRVGKCITKYVTPHIVESALSSVSSADDFSSCISDSSLSTPPGSDETGDDGDETKS